VKLRARGATAEQLDQLRNVVNAHCPVLDILANPVPVAIDVAIEA
jgi:hypothetical protein